jgi:hypothetical protein
MVASEGWFDGAGGLACPRDRETKRTTIKDHAGLSLESICIYLDQRFDIAEAHAPVREPNSKLVIWNSTAV